MWSKAVIVLAVVALAIAKNEKRPWHYKTRMPTVSPNINALPIQKVVEEVYRPKVFIPGWKKTVENCGVRPPSTPGTKIVGGTEATRNSWPWQVAIFLDDMYFCGGSIIDTNWVLTAAHCTDGINKAVVTAGAHNIRDFETTQRSYTSTNMTIHEDWAPLFLRNDISLIYIEEGIEFRTEIQPVCLPSPDQDLPAGVDVTATGWGRDSDDASGISEVLREVNVPTITNVACAATYGSTITDEILCVDTTGGKGTCNGDSGGPLNYDDGSGIYVTHGITSFGSSAGCEAGYPGAFTRVTKYLDWIETKTGLIIKK